MSKEDVILLLVSIISGGVTILVKVLFSISGKMSHVDNKVTAIAVKQETIEKIVDRHSEDITDLKLKAT